MNRHFQPFPPMPICPKPCAPPCPPACQPACPPPACPPETCRCDRCCGREPTRPCPPCSYLLPKILASGRVWLRRTPFCLNITNADPCMQPPYTLLSVEPAGAPPRWESAPAPQGICLHIWLSLCCHLTDSCGNHFTGEAMVEVEIPMRLTMPQGECWRNTIAVMPCARLVCAKPADSLCIDAQLEIIAEAYMTRWEPCAATPKPGCPQA